MLVLTASGRSQVTRIVFDWPEITVLSPGQEFTVRASVVDADEAVYGYAFDLAYDSSTVQMIAANQVSGGFSLPPNVTPSLGEPPRNPGPNADRGISASELFGTQTKVDQDLVDLTFRVLDTPAANIVTLSPRKRLHPDLGEQPAITYNLTQDNEAIVEGSKTYLIQVPVVLSTSLISGYPTISGSPFTVAIDMSEAPENIAEAHIKVSATENSVTFVGARPAEWSPDNPPAFEPDEGSAPYNDGGFDYRYVHAADFAGTTTFAQGRMMLLDFKTTAAMGETFSIQLGAYDNTPPNSTLAGQSLTPLSVTFESSNTQGILVGESPITRSEVAQFLIGTILRTPDTYDLNTDGVADIGDAITAPPTN